MPEPSNADMEQKFEAYKALTSAALPALKTLMDTHPDLYTELRDTLLTGEQLI